MQAQHQFPGQLLVAIPEATDGGSDSGSPGMDTLKLQKAKASGQSRKRRSDSATNTAAEQSADACNPDDDRRERKRVSNRESARRMRLKRQESRRRLEARLTQLAASNERLEARAQALEQHGKQLAAGLQRVTADQQRLRTLLPSCMTTNNVPVAATAAAPAAALAAVAGPSQPVDIVPGFMEARAAMMWPGSAAAAANLRAGSCVMSSSSGMAQAMHNLKQALPQNDLSELYHTWLSGGENEEDDQPCPPTSEHLAEPPAAAADAAAAPAAPSHGDLLEQLASMMGISSSGCEGEQSGGGVAEPSSCKSAGTGGALQQQPWLLLPPTPSVEGNEVYAMQW